MSRTETIQALGSLTGVGLVCCWWERPVPYDATLASPHGLGAFALGRELYSHNAHNSQNDSVHAIMRIVRILRIVR